jgi:hypothetical protein
MKRELKRELPNELPPVDLRNDIWPKVMEDLWFNPQMVQPVYLNDPDTGQRIGEFFINLLVQKGERYIQFQGFDNLFAQKAFVDASEDLEMVQPGIYRINIKNTSQG